MKKNDNPSIKKEGPNLDKYINEVFPINIIQRIIFFLDYVTALNMAHTCKRFNECVILPYPPVIEEDDYTRIPKDKKLALSETLIMENVVLHPKWVDIIKKYCLRLKCLLIRPSCTWSAYCELDFGIHPCLQRIFVKMNILNVFSLYSSSTIKIRSFALENFTMHISSIQKTSYMYEKEIQLYIDGFPELKSW
jgi:hypothetical protein